MGITTIQLHKATRDKLKKYAIKDESYDGLLNRWMNEHKPLISTK